MAIGADVESWATATSTNADDGRRIVFRYAERFRSGFDRASQPVRVIIVWKYRSESGQPLAEEHKQMNLLEDILEPVLEEGPFATLALVSTGENLREWTYYAKSEDELMALSRLRSISPFPVTRPQRLCYCFGVANMAFWRAT